MTIEGIRCSPLAPNHPKVGAERNSTMKSGTYLKVHYKLVSEKDTLKLQRTTLNK